ncbi:hypothetical protein ACLMJK_003125 [Lecanora helva]
MLSRETSVISHRPQRSKSTSSIQYRVSGFGENPYADSQNVHQDALTAANLAYERASQDQTSHNGRIALRTEQTSSRAEEGRKALERRQSVRFVGPKAAPGLTRSITRREARAYDDDQASPRPSGQSRPMELRSHIDETSMTALPDDFNENYVSSQPSSYRRLRKAKSMFSPRKAPSTGFANRIPNGRKHFQRHSGQSSVSTSEAVSIPDPRLKRSYSFLRGVNDRLSTSNRQYSTNDAAIQLARDTYLRELEQQRLKEQPSFLGLGKRQKAPKAFRRTVRTSSTNSYGTAISSPLPSINPEKPKGIGSRARTLSQTWRDKIKRVFKRSSDDESVPAQHLEASQPHYGGGAPDYQDLGPVLSPIPEPNAELLRRVGSRESSLRSEPVYVNQNSRPGSIRSVNSNDEATFDRSRVTSWTNSTSANTINMPSLMDRKRLSVIREDGGPHQSSSSTQRHNREGDVYATFRQPIMQSSASQLEPKRIFSALQRQINEKNRKTAIDEDEPSANTDLHQQQNQADADVGNDPYKAPINPIDTWHESTFPDDYNRLCNDKSNSHEDLTPQQIAEKNESAPSFQRGPLREVKSAFFPPSTRIERSIRSPYRQVMHARNVVGGSKSQQKLIEYSDIVSDRHHSASVIRSESAYSQSSSGNDGHTMAYSGATEHSNSDVSGGTAILPTHSSRHEISPRPFFPPRYSSVNSIADWKNDTVSQRNSSESVEDHDSPAIDVTAGKSHHHKREMAQLHDDDDDTGIGLSQGPSVVPKQPLGILQSNVIRQPQSNAEGASFMADNSPTLMFFGKENENRPSPSPLWTRSEKENKSLLNNIETLKNNSPQMKRSNVPLTPRSDVSKQSTPRSPRFSQERAERLRRLKSNSSTTLRKTPSLNEDQTMPEVSFAYGQRKHELANLRRDENNMPIQAGKNTKLVNSFLRDRRRDMHISEESNNDPAFL